MTETRERTDALELIRKAKVALAKAYLTRQDEQGKVETETLCLEAREQIDKAIAELQKR